MQFAGLVRADERLHFGAGPDVAHGAVLGGFQVGAAAVGAQPV